MCLVGVCALAACAVSEAEPPEEQAADAAPDQVWQSFPGTNGRIAFAVLKDGGLPVVHTVNPDGTGRLPFPNPSNVAQAEPSWSPDGKKLAFASSPDTAYWEIHTAYANGSCDTQLTHNPTPGDQGGSGRNPDWSPDGAKIAFVRQCDVFTRNAKPGGAERDLTKPAGCFEFELQDFCPAWSPDGTHIAFLSARSGNWDIFIMDEDGANKVNLTNSSAYEGCPEWSPDGTRLVFNSDRDGPNLNYYVMDVSTGVVSRLTNFGASAGYLSDPAWSPNGTRIAFVSEFQNPGANQFVLYTMRASDGGGIKPVARDAWPGDLDWGPRFDGEAVTWISAIRVAVTCNTLMKGLSAPTGWNAGAASVQALAGDGWVEFTTRENTTNKIAGLSNGDTDDGYTDIDFGIDLRDDGAVLISDGSAFHKLVGSYVAGDVFRVRVKAGVVTYWQNGVKLYRSLATPVFPLLVDTSLWTPGATISDVVLDAN